MPIPDLYPAQRELLEALIKTGPARWMLHVAPAAAPYINTTMSAYLQETCTYLNCEGLVVSPASNMHKWWGAGWQGVHISSVGFLQPYTGEKTYGVVLFDEQSMYSDTFLERLDEFLANHAERAILKMPAKTDLKLNRVLAKNRFTLLNVN